jgi:hypothetical protein
MHEHQRLMKQFVLLIFYWVWINGVPIGLRDSAHKKLQRHRDKPLAKKLSTHHSFQHTMEQVASS